LISPAALAQGGHGNEIARMGFVDQPCGFSPAVKEMKYPARASLISPAALAQGGQGNEISRKGFVDQPCGFSPGRSRK
jgi:hypothetical protein